MRKSMSRRRDRRVFSRSARKSKVINLKPYGMRGGIRL